MDALRRAIERLRAFFRKAPLDRDLDAEIASHLAFAIEENLGRGLSPQEASRQALVRFGGVAQSQEQHREARGLPALDVLLAGFALYVSLIPELKHALRTLVAPRQRAVHHNSWGKPSVFCEPDRVFMPERTNRRSDPSAVEHFSTKMFVFT